MLFHLATFQTTHCLSVHVDASPEVHEDEVFQDELGVQEEEVVGWGRSSAKYSAQFVLSHSRYFCIEGSS